MKGVKQFAAILLIIVMLSGVGVGLLFSLGLGEEDPTNGEELATEELGSEALVVEEDVDLPVVAEDLFSVNLDSPKENDLVTSPLDILGTAQGYMYFEGEFDVRIEDSEGNILGETFATAQGDWMTEEYVPFTANLEFEESATPSGNLILKNANPSDLEELNKETIILINFE